MYVVSDGVALPSSRKITVLVTISAEGVDFPWSSIVYYRREQCQVSMKYFMGIKCFLCNCILFSECHVYKHLIILAEHPVPVVEDLSPSFNRVN